MPNVRFRPIDQLAAEWNVVGRGRASRQALELLSEAEPAVAALAATDLSDLISSLHGSGRFAGSAQAPRVVEAMLRSQEVHPLVPRAILQAVVPGLVGVARRLSWGSGGDWEDGGAFFADLVATTWEVIVAWSGEDRPYAILDLLSAVRCRLRRQILHHKSTRGRVALGLEADDAIIGRPGEPTSDLDVLAKTIEQLSGRGLDPSDAAVLYGTGVLGLSICELAELTGRSRRHLTARRQRAERQLCA